MRWFDSALPVVSSQRHAPRERDVLHSGNGGDALQRAAVKVLRVAFHIFHSTGSRFRREFISMATILVAEDNADARRPLVRLLKMEGYDVLIATDALEAMACAQRGHPDLGHSAALASAMADLHQLWAGTLSWICDAGNRME